MKHFTLLCLLMLPLAAWAQGTTTDSPERQNRLDDFGQELREIRREVDRASTGASQITRSQYDQAYDALDRAENILAQLKTASEFDRSTLEAQFQEAKMEAVRTWANVRTQVGIQGPVTAP